MELEQEIFSSIFSKVKEMDRMHSGRIAVIEPPVLAQREKILHVYEEGEQFGGIESVGVAEACLAPIPVPHVSASVPAKDFLSVAKEILGENTNLPFKYERVEYFSPQVVLWWRRKNDSKPYDPIDLSNLPVDEQRHFSAVISKKAVEAVKFISTLKGRPSIWGTWGYGDSEERIREGLTRGGPTVRNGHMHFTFFERGEQKLKFRDLSPKDKLNHYAPWNEIILEKFGNSLSSALNDFRHESGPKFTVKRINEHVHHTDGAISIHNGFLVEFETATTFEEVLQFLIGLAGTAENLYQQVHSIFAIYHKSGTLEQRKTATEQMEKVLGQAGFQSKETRELVKFITSIRPTYGQLLTWHEELKGQAGAEIETRELARKINRYTRLRKKLESKPLTKNLGVAIIEDSIKQPSDNDIAFTWPVHASFCYLIDDYELIDDKIYIKSLRLYPEFVTTGSAVERILGVVLKRPTRSLSETEPDQAETARIQQSLVRDESEIWMMRGYFYKRMTPLEMKAYKLLSLYQKQLLENAGIITPFFYGRITQEELKELHTFYKNFGRLPSNDLCKISILNGVRHRDIDESYGLGIDYSSKDFKDLFESLRLFRKIVTPNSKISGEDYEPFPIRLLNESQTIIDRSIELGVDSKTVFRVLRESGDLLDSVELIAVHRDLNWSNMGTSRLLESKRLFFHIVDWGSFGLAHAGYDEGRLFTRLTLNPVMQKVFLESLTSVLHASLSPQEAREFLLSFWNTVAIRSYREIFLALTGRYQRPINHKYKTEEEKTRFLEEFIRSFEIMLDAAIENLNYLLFN